MKNIVINRQGFASRCEVCHKNDRFDATTNFCSRCQSVGNELNSHELMYGRYFSRTISSHLITSKIAREMQKQNPPKPKTLLDKVVDTEGTPIYVGLFTLVFALWVNHEPSLTIKLIVLVPLLISFVIGCIWAVLRQIKTRSY